jgi:hypothetical protein
MSFTNTFRTQNLSTTSDTVSGQARTADPRPASVCLASSAQTATSKRHCEAVSTKALEAVCSSEVLLLRILKFVGPDEYLFAAGINRAFKQAQIVYSHKYAAADGVTNNKLRTSFKAAFTSPARLLWAFQCGLKETKLYENLIELIEEAVPPTSTDLNSTTSSTRVLLDLVALKRARKADADQRAQLCAAAAKRGDLQLLQQLRALGCDWNADTCMWAAQCGHLGVLMWAHHNGCEWDTRTCRCAAAGGYLHILQWARGQGCPWDTYTCSLAVLNRRWSVLKWAHANGCPWDLGEMLLDIAANDNVEMLNWLQRNSERPWTAAEKTSMLQHAGRHGSVEAMQWLRKRGTAWPTSFVGSTAHRFTRNTNKCWALSATKWALINGYTWTKANWQCQQLAPELYLKDDKNTAKKVLKWAHKHGCPCTCNNSNNGSDLLQH